MKLKVAEEIGRLECEYLEMTYYRSLFGSRTHNKRRNKDEIDEINDALLDIQEEHYNLSGHYYYPSQKEKKDYIDSARAMVIR